MNYWNNSNCINKPNNMMYTNDLKKTSSKSRHVNWKFSISFNNLKENNYLKCYSSRNHNESTNFNCCNGSTSVSIIFQSKPNNLRNDTIKLSNYQDINISKEKKKLLIWLKSSQTKRDINNQRIFRKWLNRINSLNQSDTLENDLALLDITENNSSKVNSSKYNIIDNHMTTSTLISSSMTPSTYMISNSLNRGQIVNSSLPTANISTVSTEYAHLAASRQTETYTPTTMNNKSSFVENLSKSSVTSYNESDVMIFYNNNNIEQNKWHSTGNFIDNEMEPKNSSLNQSLTTSIPTAVCNTNNNTLEMAYLTNPSIQSIVPEFQTPNDPIPTTLTCTNSHTIMPSQCYLPCFLLYTNNVVGLDSWCNCCYLNEYSNCIPFKTIPINIMPSNTTTNIPDLLNTSIYLQPIEKQEHISHSNFTPHMNITTNITDISSNVIPAAMYCTPANSLIQQTHQCSHV
ncbi:hypothetical protein EWB00_000514 [Schistosoma japonicum]|uniref:Uncharacterized protein n=1 Tax=Schistosoma japonicum TaxID=6182 RepID=A0A4Z2DIT7_SCHJA|nr:hypothetical protein EWB00_000514 [Schistosoma japonicum]